jgi:lipopolysaccharide/colanic/teichoic acid biosynthesis glycosyltransferase
LGQKYTFTNLELKQLSKKFDNIEMLTYKDKNPSDVISKIDKSLNKRFTVIVLNTKVKVDDEIIKYLTNLKFSKKSKKFKIISIEHFLEEYLYKCYIPKDNDDLHYLDDIRAFSLSMRIQKMIIDYVSVFFLFIIYFFIRFIVKKKISQQSAGNIYFRQLRIGLNNKAFKCIKFRTMNNHNANRDIRTATKDDNRIFDFGQTMRKTRIDELPQVFNILKGQMSLIGPRAEWNKLTVDYEKQIPYYSQRHIVKPGITGWAQVMFVEGRSKDDTRQKLMYDLYYIKHWSFLLELKVIWKTVMVVVGKKGI